MASWHRRGLRGAAALAAALPLRRCRCRRPCGVLDCEQRLQLADQAAVLEHLADTGDGRKCTTVGGRAFGWQVGVSVWAV